MRLQHPMKQKQHPHNNFIQQTLAVHITIPKNLYCSWKMLRSQDIPAKLVVGYTGDAYHAWVNVYIDGVGWIDNYIYFDGTNWSLADPTFASTGGQSDSIKQYIGDGANYQQKYCY